jgi:hypothetical protein
MGREGVSIKREGFFVDYRCVPVNASPEAIYRVITSLGCPNGWLYADWLWRLRGWIDRVFPPRASQKQALTERMERTALSVGDRVDYYQVEELQPHRMMRLHSLLRAPGDGWMEWRIDGAVLTQTAFFAPRGLPGFLYWYVLGPLHQLVFRGLIREVKRRSENG